MVAGSNMAARQAFVHRRLRTSRYGRQNGRYWGLQLLGFGRGCQCARHRTRDGRQQAEGQGESQLPFPLRHPERLCISRQLREDQQRQSVALYELWILPCGSAQSGAQLLGQAFFHKSSIQGQGYEFRPTFLWAERQNNSNLRNSINK